MATDITTPDSESPSHNNKPMGFLAYANGALNRHYPTAKPESPPPTVAVSYKECLRNHAAAIGGHALDGCCEFMPSPMFNPSVPTSLRCAACGCHRNFHRQNNAPPPPDSPYSPPTPATAPNMLMTLRKSQSAVTPATRNRSGKKRFRTKFSQDQKERMFDFAERLGWKMQRTDKTTVQDFCSEIGVGKEVLKVWMHNNKNTLGRKDNGGNGATPAAAAGGHNNNGGDRFGRVHQVSANASSSSD